MGRSLAVVGVAVVRRREGLLRVAADAAFVQSAYRSPYCRPGLIRLGFQAPILAAGRSALRPLPAPAKRAGRVSILQASMEVLSPPSRLDIALIATYRPRIFAVSLDSSHKRCSSRGLHPMSSTHHRTVIHTINSSGHIFDIHPGLGGPPLIVVL